MKEKENSKNMRESDIIKSLAIEIFEYWVLVNIKNLSQSRLLCDSGYNINDKPCKKNYSMIIKGMKAGNIARQKILFLHACFDSVAISIFKIFFSNDNLLNKLLLLKDEGTKKEIKKKIQPYLDKIKNVKIFRNKLICHIDEDINNDDFHRDRRQYYNDKDEIKFINTMEFFGTMVDSFLNIIKILHDNSLLCSYFDDNYSQFLNIKEIRRLIFSECGIKIKLKEIYFLKKFNEYIEILKTTTGIYSRLNAQKSHLY